MSEPISRRKLFENSTVMGASLLSSQAVCSENRWGEDPLPHFVTDETCLTPAEDFYTVARGKPKPHSLQGQDLINARMTPESWRLEIVADDRVSTVQTNPAVAMGKELTIADGTALDYQTLLDLGESTGVRFIKAIQCLNIPAPLGQGLWEGVLLRDILRLCGKMKNVRRVFYWGFHNEDPKQRFQSSLSYSQAVDWLPNDPPVFLAYRLNGKPISPLRGGPVRMIVPWAYGFKSIKWLQKIVLSNDPQSNDTYSRQNNDPDSPMKTAAYLNRSAARKRFSQDDAIEFSGLCVSGQSGLSSVEYSVLESPPDQPRRLADDPDLARASWIPCAIGKPPSDWKSVLPDGISTQQILGFDGRSGRPKQWPLRYGMGTWSSQLGQMKSGRYEFRVRTVDENGFAQPEPRPIQKSGRNSVDVHPFEVT
jgi:DMSO/TMAO reductase YedYZ molybdopterin-dependent catalytic subunit